MGNRRLIDAETLLKELKTAEEGSMVAVKHIQKHEVYSAESIAFTTFSIVEDVINNAPIVDPMKHGRWTCGGDGIVECSACEERFFSAELRPRHYCPNCGARMDGDEHG